MKRKWLCALLLCLLPALARADAPDEAMRLVVYTAHKEEVYQPIVEEFERRTGVWVQVGCSVGGSKIIKLRSGGAGLDERP